MENPSRREVLMAGAAAVALVPAIAPLSAQPATTTPLFFTPREFQMVDELSEIIIPADDHSPGAHAAQVAAHIDKSLGESFEDKPRQEWREGLGVVEKLCQEMHGTVFLDASPAQRVEVVARMARRESDPKKPEELFFHRLKGRTALAYYTSKIGIHQEMEYKGNTILEEFAGLDAGLVSIPPATKA